MEVMAQGMRSGLYGIGEGLLVGSQVDMRDIPRRLERVVGLLSVGCSHVCPIEFFRAVIETDNDAIISEFVNACLKGTYKAGYLSVYGNKAREMLVPGAEVGIYDAIAQSMLTYGCLESTLALNDALQGDDAVSSVDLAVAIAFVESRILTVEEGEYQRADHLSCVDNAELIITRRVKALFH